MADVTTVLDDAGVEYELLSHAHTERAADEAAALGLPPTAVAKTLVLTAPEGHVRVVLPASERIDLRKARSYVEGSKRVHLATEEELAPTRLSESGCPAGGMERALPPAGDPARPPRLLAPIIDELVNARLSERRPPTRWHPAATDPAGDPL